MYFSDLGLTFTKCEFFILEKKRKMRWYILVEYEIGLKRKQTQQSEVGLVPCPPAEVNDNQEGKERSAPPTPLKSAV